MTIARCRAMEGFLAGAAYALAAYALAASALLLSFLLCHADAKPVTYALGANSFTDLVALAATPEPALLAVRPINLGQFGSFNCRHRLSVKLRGDAK